MKQLDVVSLGEALVDFLPLKPGKRVAEVPQWVRCLGGAPANVAVGIARLGGRSGMAGVTGDDEFGRFIADELQREGVDTTALRHTKEGKTGIAFISLLTSGERSFIFYRHQAAEFLLSPELLDEPYLANTQVLHLGTNSLLQHRARAASLKAARAAQAAGRLVSCDPNLRLHLWPDANVLKELLGWLLPICSVVKLSDEEIEFVTGTADCKGALAQLMAMGVAVSVVTRGAKGAMVAFRGETVSVPAPKVKVLDTTGAGDGFMAGFLFALSRRYRDRAELSNATLDSLEACARFGCEVGSRVVTKLGAVAGLPTYRQLPAKVRRLAG